MYNWIIGIFILMKDDKWRIVGFERNSGFRNMALDEAIFQGLKQNSSRPTVRLYGWDPSCVSIGFFQGLEKEVDLEACEKESIDFVRRQTGGGAVFHDFHGEITYSIVAKEEHFESSYDFESLCQPVIDFLNSIGVDAYFEPVNDIHSGGKKISGNARTAEEGVVLQHGTILYQVNPEEMFTYLKPEVEEVSDEIKQSVRKKVTSIDQKTDISRGSCIEELENFFRNAKFHDGISKEGLTKEEKQRADEIESKKYRDTEWTYKR